MSVAVKGKQLSFYNGDKFHNCLPWERGGGGCASSMRSTLNPQEPPRSTENQRDPPRIKNFPSLREGPEGVLYCIFKKYMHAYDVPYCFVFLVASSTASATLGMQMSVRPSVCRSGECQSFRHMTCGRDLYIYFPE